MTRKFNPKRARAFLALPFLAGCAMGDVEALRNTQPTGSPFTVALTNEYKRFAIYENDEMRDWFDAGHFARKGLLAAHGDPVAPETLRAWRLPVEKTGELAAAHLRLVSALATGARERMPKSAAKAQASFDCWVEQQEENFQADDIAACRKAFSAALAGVEKRAEGKTSIPFAFDSARLSQVQMARLDNLAQRIASNKNQDIIIHGHADRAGTEPYNRNLSRARAIAVWRRMADSGVPAKRMAIRASGEDKPAVATRDGVKNAKNRRAEILFRTDREPEPVAELQTLKISEPQSYRSAQR